MTGDITQEIEKWQEARHKLVWPIRTTGLTDLTFYTGYIDLTGAANWFDRLADFVSSKTCIKQHKQFHKTQSEKLSGQFLSLIVMSHWLGDLWIRIWDDLFVLRLSLFHLKNHVCLSCGAQVVGAAWRAATRIVVGVRDLMQRIKYDRTTRILSGRAIEKSGGAVCCLWVVWPQNHSDDFSLVWASKPMTMVCQWFDLKTTGMVFACLAWKLVAVVSGGLASKPTMTVSDGLASKPAATASSGLASKSAMTVSSGLTSKPAAAISSGLASKPAATVSSGLTSKPAVRVSPGLASKPVVEGFPVWASKPAAMVWWFGPQNHRGGFLVCASKSSRLQFVGCATKLTEGGRRETRIEIYRLASRGSMSG
jgi:hypothetical protein